MVSRSSSWSVPGRPAWWHWLWVTISSWDISWRTVSPQYSAYPIKNPQGWPALAQGTAFLYMSPSRSMASATFPSTAPASGMRQLDREWSRSKSKPGFFTRALGGVHGILYVQDTTVERTLPGMNETIDFLAIRPHITFITTKWDIPQSTPKPMRKCEDREAEIRGVTWARFGAGVPGGSRYFRHGVDCMRNSQQVQEHGRNRLWPNAMAHYRNVSAEWLLR